MGGGGRAPRDVLVLLGVLFGTFALQFFEATQGVIALLRLSPAVWQRGFLWQLFTYPFAGFGGPSLWFLLVLLMTFWFGRDVFGQLGRRRFWRLLVGVAATAGSVAVAVAWIGETLAANTWPAPFYLLQGQHALLAILVAAFGTLYRDATVYFFFVLPLKARWLLPIEIVIAFFGFLNPGTRDLPGFLGICAAVGTTWLVLTAGSLRRMRRESWLRLQQRWLRLKLRILRRRRGLKVIEGERDQGNGKVRRGPWVH